MVSVEKMLTNILRKLEVDVERNVVSAHIRATPPRTEADRSRLVWANTSARIPNSAAIRLNIFMGIVRDLGVRALRGSGSDTSTGSYWSVSWLGRGTVS